MSEPTFIGGEFRVNTFTSGNQRTSAITELSDGSFVVVWQSTGQDGGGYGVFGQRYSASGNTIGSEFRINNTVAGDQENVSISSYDGYFVVTWESFGSDDDIYARTFTNDLNSSSPELRLNTFTTGAQAQPDIASNGSTVAVWWSADHKIYTSQVWYSSYGSNVEIAAGVDVFSDPTITALESISGRFLISYNKGGSRYAKILDTSGATTAGSEFALGSGTMSNAAELLDGRFVVVFAGGGGEITGRIFNGDGSLSVGSFAINQTIIGDQSQPEITALSGGGFFVVWNSDGQDGSGLGIFGQRFTDMGRAIGNEIRINTETVDHQASAKVVELDNGDLVVTWQSYNQDGSGAGVFAQRLAVPVAELDQVINGTSGMDNLTGAEGFDIINGFAGDDILRGAGGDDTIVGGDGNDSIIGGNGKDSLTGGTGDDVVRGSAGRDIVKGNAGNDSLFGGKGYDRIFGGAGDDLLLGAEGRDKLLGGAGRDDIRGGAGADTVQGNGGDDLLSGGTGADRFIFRTGDGMDRISDFEVGVDVIRVLSGAANFSEITVVDLGADALITFSDVVVRLENVDHLLLDSGSFIF